MAAVFFVLPLLFVVKGSDIASLVRRHVQVHNPSAFDIRLYEYFRSGVMSLLVADEILLQCILELDCRRPFIDRGFVVEFAIGPCVGRNDYGIIGRFLLLENPIKLGPFSGYKMIEELVKCCRKSVVQFVDLRCNRFLVQVF